MQGSDPICKTCRHSMLTKVEVMVQANKTEHGRIIPVGVSRESLIQPWCFYKGAGVPISMAVLECEGYEPADDPKVLLNPASFAEKAA
jgi:hypothetical protein